MFVEIICIIDRSGSMASIKDDAIGGFNTFLKEQQDHPGEANLTFVQFDTEYEVVHENKPIKKVPLLTTETYRPRGATALLDAIGKTINETTSRIDKTPKEKQPEKVIVCILTDGEENSSKEFKKAQIKQLVEQQKTQNWEFIFLAANQDAFAEGFSMGISAGDTVTFVSTGAGTRNAYNTMSNMGAAYRSDSSKLPDNK